MPSMDEYAQFQEVHQLLGSDPLSRQVLELLRRENSATGWSIAKMMDADSKAVGESLAKLRRNGLIDTESGSGLDGFYFLTRLAFRLLAPA
jgi:Mn-dependent DtxR family transcriptional regulator